MSMQIQCDSCAFKVTESQVELEDDVAVEDKYKVLRSLINAPKKPRVIDASIGGEKTEETDKTETCFINSPLWPIKAETDHCPDRVNSAFFSLETALSLRQASEAICIAREAVEIAKDEARFARLSADAARDQASSARDQASSAREQARFARWAAIIAAIAAIIAIRDQINSTISILLN